MTIAVASRLEVVNSGERSGGRPVVGGEPGDLENGLPAGDGVDRLAQQDGTTAVATTKTSLTGGSAVSYRGSGVRVVWPGE